MEEKKSRRIERKQAWNQLFSSKPDENFEDPADVAAIKHVREFCGQQEMLFYNSSSKICKWIFDKNNAVWKKVHGISFQLVILIREKMLIWKLFQIAFAIWALNKLNKCFFHQTPGSRKHGWLQAKDSRGLRRTRTIENEYE